MNQQPDLAKPDASTRESAKKDDASQDGENGTPSLSRSVGKIATLMQREGGGLSTGDLAELRRISPDAPFTPALWKLLLGLKLDESPPWISQSEWERRWAVLSMGMAICAGLHDYNIPLGQALASAGWSELRFVRLLRAEGEKLETHVRWIAQYLASKSQPANWDDVRKLLFSQSGDYAENTRLKIARSYYRTLYTMEN